MNNWTTVFHDGCHSINHVAMDLVTIATALHRVGNLQLATELRAYAEHLETTSEEMRLAISNKVEDDVRFSSEATHNMVAGVMAGIELGKARA